MEKKFSHTQYDIVIVGAGISGAAQAYALARYTVVRRIAIIEKYPKAGSVNSHPTRNSQTLHEGDIETNYSKEKARTIQRKSSFTRTYLLNKDNPALYMRGPKMVLGVGEDEVASLKKRFTDFTDIYPDLTLLDRAALSEKEPAIVKGRAPHIPLAALYNPDGITVHYAHMAEALLKDASAAVADDTNRTLDVVFNTAVKTITKTASGYRIEAAGETISTRFLSVAAGAHSMYFAKKLSIPDARTISLLNVAGNFYYTPKLLGAKTYTVQNPKLPFAAVHGDPDILQGDKTRYGPTTRIVFMLERHKWSTIGNFLKTVPPLFGSLRAYTRILLDRDFFWYAVKHNILFPLPFFGTYFFSREVRKIIPTVSTRDVVRARGQGGIRPQIIETTKKDPLNLGEAKLSGENALFNVTPSPGATTALYNGLVDARTMANACGSAFDEEKITRDFGAALDA